MKLKGVGLKNTLASLEKLHGKEGLERVKQAMPPRLREPLTQVLPIEWYQVEVTAALHIAIRDTLGGGSWDESQRISMEAAKLELNGVYRVMLRAVQYDTVWDRMERMWRTYYDAGEAKWVDRGQGHATAQFTRRRRVQRGDVALRRGADRDPARVHWGARTVGHRERGGVNARDARSALARVTSPAVGRTTPATRSKEEGEGPQRNEPRERSA